MKNFALLCLKSSEIVRFAKIPPATGPSSSIGMWRNSQDQWCLHFLAPKAIKAIRKLSIFAVILHLKLLLIFTINCGGWVVIGTRLVPTRAGHGFKSGKTHYLWNIFSFWTLWIGDFIKLARHEKVLHTYYVECTRKFCLTKNYSQTCSAVFRVSYLH